MYDALVRDTNGVHLPCFLQIEEGPPGIEAKFFARAGAMDEVEIYIICDRESQHRGAGYQ